MAAARRLALPAVALAAAVAAPALITGFEQQGLLVLTAIYALMALSLGLIMGLAGQWSFGHQAFLGIGAYAGMLIARDLELPGLLSVLAGGIVAGVVGAALGFVALRRTRGMHLAVITLAFGVIVYLVALQWRDVTGGRVGVFLAAPLQIGPGEGLVTFSDDVSFYYLALTLLCLTIAGYAALLRTRTGTALRAVSSNETLARAVGVGPLGYLVLAFGLGAALAGVAGGLLSNYVGVVNPGLMSIDYLFAMLIMVVLGGARTIAGPVVGAVIYIWLPEVFGIGDDLKLLFFAVVLALVVAVLPQGLYPAARAWLLAAAERARSLGGDATIAGAERGAGR